MKARTVLILLLSALLFCTSCETQQPEEVEGNYLLYFQSVDGDPHGPALEGEPWSPASSEEPVEAEELLRALLAGPTGEGLVSPFPKGVYLTRVEEEGSTLKVRLSEAYSGLSDISLTLADYSIVLTLSQLEGVEAVEIQTAGYSSNYRSHQILKPEEALMSDPLQTEESFS